MFCLFLLQIRLWTSWEGVTTNYATLLEQVGTRLIVCCKSDTAHTTKPTSVKIATMCQIAKNGLRKGSSRKKQTYENPQSPPGEDKTTTD